MMTVIYAARNLRGGSYDVWDVNVEESYHEESRARGPADGPASQPTDRPAA